jgi:hypothetical protein
MARSALGYEGQLMSGFLTRLDGPRMRRGIGRITPPGAAPWRALDFDYDEVIFFGWICDRNALVEPQPMYPQSLQTVLLLPSHRWI